MDITRGSLEDISRPASSERVRVGSRVSTASLGEGGSRIVRQNPVSLEVLSTDAIQVNTMVFETKSVAESISDEDTQSDHLPKDVSDEENDDQELQKAIKKMKRLDKVLAQKVSKEKEVKKKGRELSQKLWQGLQELSVNSGSKDAIENTKLFLALTSSTSQEPTEEQDIVTVFGTQIPEKEYEKHCSHQECIKGESKNDSASGPSEVDQEQNKESEAESRQTGDATGKQTQNFVKKNIELASSGQCVPMTVEEKQRLCELLWDIEAESQGHLSPAAQGMASLCTTSIQLDQGYTPELSELDQLIQIDARLQTLLPPQDFLSVRSPYPDHNTLQALDLEQALVDSPLGEETLQAQRDRRGQETRLREIQQKLDTMEHSQTDSAEMPRLAEEQLQSLLLECELALSRAQTLSTHRTSPQGPFSSAASEVEIEGDWSPPLSCTPRLSSAALSELLREFKSPVESSVDTAAPAEVGERH